MSEPISGPGAGNDSSKANPSMNPLFGAPPPPTSPPSTSTSASTASSAQPLDTHASSSFSDRIVSSSSMYGATPDLGPYPHNGHNYDSDVRDTDYSEQRFPTISYANQQSNLLTSLRRLSFIISILLGASSLLALTWSTFLLPLLHASFSARNVLVSQHQTKMLDFLRMLKDVMARKIYPLPPPISKSERADGAGEENEGDEEEVEGRSKRKRQDHVGMRREASLKEINSPPSPSTSSHSSDHNHHQEQNTKDKGASATGADADENKSPHIPLTSLIQLTHSLKELTSSLDATSTTRTSLISTLESYTSQIHRQLFVPRQFNSNNFGGVGLGSLSANLSQAGGGSSVLDAGGAARGEEWDAVRKEVRAIKGLLLNRRAFVNSNPS